MPKIEISQEIQGTEEHLFEQSQDYAIRLSWDPFLSEVKFLGEEHSYEKGSRVWVKAKNGLSMSVEIIRYQQPTIVAMKMVRGPFFFETFAGSWRFQQLTTTTCKVTFQYHINMIQILRFRWVESLVLSVLKKDMTQRLKAFKSWIEVER